MRFLRRIYLRAATDYKEVNVREWEGEYVNGGRGGGLGVELSYGGTGPDPL